MRKNKHDHSGACLERGLNTEESFKLLAESRGWDVEKTTFQQELKHVDFVLTKDNKVVKIDVKAQKKISRKDDNVQDELCWVEISGVRGSGWLHGESDSIAFERGEEFLIVNKDSLSKFIYAKCDLEDFVKASKDAYMKSYRRWNRHKEHLTIVKFSDIIKECKHKVWNKQGVTNKV